MLTGGARLAARAHRRARLERTVALSVVLHLAALSLVLTVVRLPALPTEPPSVEVMVDAAPAEGDKPPPSSAPASAVPTEAVPTEAVPTAAPPPAPELEAQPPPPPDQIQANLQSAPVPG
jgi:hypothetical protein